ncbi:MAG TPA: class I SAM-dependent methyltransferase [Bryobacteraceae bacterium]
MRACAGAVGLPMNILEQPSIGFRPAAFLSGAPGPWAGHLPFAADLVTAVRPRTLVALGVPCGDAYFGFCQAIVEVGAACTCYGVDVFENAAFYEAANRHNDRLYRSFSHLLRISFDSAPEQFSNESVDLLLFSQLRGYDEARNTFERWLPKVRPGSVILLDGITIRSADHGAWRLWEELSRDWQSFAFAGGNGLGVLRKPADAGGGNNAYLDELFLSSPAKQERIRRYYTLCSEHIQLEFAAKDRERLQSRQSALMQQIAIGRGNIEELTAEIERLTTAEADSRAALVEARKANARITALMEQERMLRIVMENSYLWRLTKPLRVLFALFRRDVRS